MNNVTRLAVKNDTAQHNYQVGYDKGYEDGLSQSHVNGLVTGFWVGLGTAAVLIVVVWLTVLMGKI